MSMLKYVLNMPGIRPAYSWLQGTYSAAVEKQLKKYGLLYDDVLSDSRDDVKRVLAILPEEELLMRQKRIKRAFDISVKKTSLHPDLQADLDVWYPYIRSRFPTVRKQRAEELAYKRD